MNKKLGEKKAAWNFAKVLWNGTYAIGFDCACGEEDLQVTDEDIVTCICGCVYELRVEFTVRKPE